MSGIPAGLVAIALVAVLVCLEVFRRRDRRASRRIEELKAGMEAMKWEISSLEKLKSELLTRIGSSLRKPLSSVRESTLEITRPLDSSPEMTRQMQKLTAEIDEIEHFLGVLGEIAVLENMEENADGTPPLAGKESTRVDLESLVSDVLARSTKRLTESGISLTVSMDDDMAIDGNERYLTHAVSNILNEAIRYTAQGGIVSVELARMEDSVRLKVRSRGESAGDIPESTLGVELARQIMNAHGGWLTEGRGRGEYTASLPPAGSPGGSPGEASP
jgi:signal transduction histidine kinase